jgi:hypothetical protein
MEIFHLNLNSNNKNMSELADKKTLIHSTAFEEVKSKVRFESD